MKHFNFSSVYGSGYSGTEVTNIKFVCPLFKA